nr:MAG TPA: hypothetical protein [Caudoviricetes sp.]
MILQFIPDKNIIMNIFVTYGYGLNNISDIPPSSPIKS